MKWTFITIIYNFNFLFQQSKRSNGNRPWTNPLSLPTELNSNGLNFTVLNLLFSYQIPFSNSMMPVKDKSAKTICPVPENNKKFGKYLWGRTQPPMTLWVFLWGQTTYFVDCGKLTTLVFLLQVAPHTNLFCVGSCRLLRQGCGKGGRRKPYIGGTGMRNSCGWVSLFQKYIDTFYFHKLLSKYNYSKIHVQLTGVNHL